MAQAQTAPPEPTPDMDVIARSLGVTCGYCHVPGDFKSDGNPKKAIAREMIAMTRDLNARIRTATGKAAADSVRMECVSCHRGAPIPRRLTEILLRTMTEKGAEAAAVQYRDLRTRYYARDVYDFTEDDLLAFCSRLAESARPENALPLLKMNLEYNPKSANTYIVMSRVHTRMRDTAAAIEALKKAIEIEPNNGLAQGYLYQLQPRGQ